MYKLEITKEPKLTFRPRIRDIQNVTWPNTYNQEMYQDDIALVESETPFKGFDWKPACLANSDFVERFKGKLLVSARLLSFADHRKTLEDS